MRSSRRFRRTLAIAAAFTTGLAALVALGPAAPASAAGTYDPTFASGGRMAVGQEGYRIADVDQLPDDRFVAVIVRPRAEKDQIEVRRYLPNGVGDLSWAGTGNVITGGPRGEWTRPSIAFDPTTGSTYVTAWARNLGRAMIWRFGPTGALDPNWNGTGVVGFAGNNFTDLAVTASGRLLASRDSSLYRFNTTGQVDPSFGASGVTMPTSVDSIAVQPDRSILLSGHGTDTLDVYHLKETGQFKSFGTGGRAFYRATPPLGTSISAVSTTDLGVQNDGSIVVAANVTERNVNNGNERSALTVVRFHRGGGLSGDFNIRHDYPHTLTGEIAVQGNDKIVLSASTSTHPNIIRLTANGAADPTWGAAGSSVDAAANGVVQSLLVQSTGRVVAVGQAADATGLIWGLVGDTVPTCFGRLATAFGDGGKNTFIGSDAEDVVVAGGGKDKIKTYGGNDRICAGGGKDKIEAGEGNDKVDAGGGNDRVEGGKGKDVIRGSRGNDKLFGGPGADRIKGGPGRDLLVGGPGRDKLTGGPGRDRIRQ